MCLESALGSGPSVLFCTAIVSIKMIKDKIINHENSGTVGVGVGEELEELELVIVKLTFVYDTTLNWLCTPRSGFPRLCQPQ